MTDQSKRDSAQRTATSLDWFDGHLDLATLAEVGRDMHAELGDCRGRYQPPAVTLPSLQAGSVRACLATVFTEAIDTEDPDAEDAAFAYPTGDALAAYRAGMRQLKLYRVWRDAGLVSLMPRRGLESPSTNGSAGPGAPLTIGVLMEGADPIPDPSELEEWVDLGVIAIGLTWARGSRYAGGNANPGGLTPLGRDMIARMDELGVVHDLSHLCDNSTDELLERTDRPVIASHSNARALMREDDQRHLRDETIIEIARRGGVIGLNLFSPFLKRDLEAGKRASIDDFLRHLDHMRSLVDPSHLALGSDMDGGFSAAFLPEQIDEPRHLARLADAMLASGWTREEIASFSAGAWRRFWGLA